MRRSASLSGRPFDVGGSSYVLFGIHDGVPSVMTRDPDGASLAGAILAGANRTFLVPAVLAQVLQSGPEAIGLFGKLTVDFTSLVIIALTATGIYLWAVPLYRKRQSAKNRAVQLPAKTVPSAAARDLQARLAAKVKQPSESLPQPAVALEVAAAESLAGEPLAVPAR